MVEQQLVPRCDLVTEWIGHSNLRTTSRYTYFRDEFRQRTANHVGALFADWYGRKIAS